MNRAETRKGVRLSLNIFGSTTRVDQIVKVFVSYSRSDQHLVKPIVSLLRTTSRKVFFDIDSITPGSKWRKSLKKSLAGSDLVVVFWCSHSAKSTEVEKEYVEAIEAGKDILPVLLDSTQLNSSLAEYQWIDFQEFHTHKNNDDKQPNVAKKKSIVIPTLIVLFAILLPVVFLQMTFQGDMADSIPDPGDGVFTSNPNDSKTVTNFPTHPPIKSGSEKKENFHLRWFPILLAGMVAVVLLLFYLLKLMRLKGDKSKTDFSIEIHKMKDQLEIELEHRVHYLDRM